MSEAPALATERRAATATLELRGIVRTYKQAGALLPILRGASLTLLPGEIVALVGPSAPASPRCCTAPGCSSIPTAGRC